VTKQCFARDACNRPRLHFVTDLCGDRANAQRALHKRVSLRVRERVVSARARACE
jgi:hypothetical protein